MIKTFKRIAVCSHCKGEGSINERFFAGHSRGWENHWLTCSNCNGSGLVRRTIEIKEESYVPKI